MSKLWIVSSAVIALSGGLFADTITSAAGTFSAFPSGFATSTPTWIDNGTNPGAGTPFWNNPSDDTGLGAGQGSNHDNNVGYLLTGTGGYTGTTSVIGTDSVTENYTNSDGTDPSAFNFVRNAASYNIALVFAEASFDSGSNPALGVGSVFGYYVGGTYTPLYNVGFTTSPTSSQVFNPTTSGGSYGFYDTVCYAATAGVCTSSETYTTGAGNSGNSGGGAGWNHFAVFQLASGSYVIGFSGQNGMFGENVGDFKDTVIELQAVPEPGTIALLGLGLAGLGLLGRRRSA